MLGARKWVAAALVVCGLLAAVEPAAAINDPPSSGGTVSGDWTVTDVRSYSNVAITLDRGNLVVRNGASLTLSNVDLVMRMDQNGQFQIEVQSGGTLVLKSGSTVSCSNPSLRYNFRIRAGAFASLGNSTVSHAGHTYSNGPAENNGIYVASDNATMDSCTITNSTYGVYVDGAAPRVSNSLFRSIGSYGIYIARGAPSILGSDLTGSSYGIVASGADPWISRCAFSNHYYGVYLSYCRGGRVENCTFKDNYYNGIYATLYSTPEIRDCTFTRNGQSDWYNGGGVRYNEYSAGVCERNVFSSPDYGNGVVCTDGASPLIEQCEMSCTYRPAVYASGSSSPRLARSTLSSVNDAPVIASGAAVSVSWCSMVSESGYGAYSNTYGSLALDNCTMTARNSYGALAASSGSLSAVNCDIGSRYDGIYSNRGRVELYRCNVSSSERAGVLAYYGASVLLERTSVTAATYGLYIYYYGARAVLRESWVEARNYYGALVIEGSLELHGSSIYATRSYAIYASSNATVKSHNSTVTTGASSSSYIYLDTGGNCLLDLYNTLFDQYRVTFREPTSRINVWWYTNVAVQWQNAARVANATLTIANARNDTVFDGRVDRRGELFGIPLQEYSRTQMLWENYTRFEFSASKSGVRKSEKRDIRSNNQTVRLTLSDPDPPVVTIVSPPGNLLTNRTRIDFSGRAVDFASGLLRVERLVDGGNWTLLEGLEEWAFTLDLADGRHNVRVRAYDVAGSAGEAALAVTVDTVISLELDGPADGALLNDGTVTVSGWAEPFSNVSVRENATDVDSEGRFEFVLDLTDGHHVLAVTARDATGNSATVTVAIDIDTVAPPLDLDSPKNGSTVASPVVPFRGRTEPGASLVIAGDQYTPGPDGAFSVMVPLAEGTNLLEVRVTDAAGNFQNLSVSIRRDTVPPKLVVESPAPDLPLLTNRRELLVEGGTDGVSVSAGNVTAEVLQGRFRVVLHLAEGENRIEVVAADEAQNRATVVLSVALDTRPPFLQLVSPPEGLTTNVASLSVTGVTEPGAAVTVNGVAAVNTNGSFAHAVRLVSGDNTVTVRAVDAAGNAATLNRTVTLDQVPPVVVITSPTSGSRIADSKVMVRGNTDAGSSVMVNGVAAQMDRSGRFTAEIPLTEGENSIVVTSVDAAGNPTTKIIQVTRTGALSISEEETPLLVGGILAGLIIGAVAGLAVGRRRRKERVVVLAPEEPEPGRYYVPDELAPRGTGGRPGTEEPAPPRPAASPAPRPSVRVDLPPPEYARPDEAYHPPEPADREQGYRPAPWLEGARRDAAPPRRGTAGTGPHLPSVPEPEETPGGEAPPMEPGMSEEAVPWEEEDARARKTPDVDRSLEDIMRRLKS
ncbi:MAG: hypothetical protein FJ149_01360 [Euryarchaeota archaeon]|nr:hypothetical protein [Euryarchaeota archaeon]